MNVIKVEEISVKHAMAAAACATALVASLAACGGGDTATPPGRTGSASANSLPPTTPTPTTATATATATGPVALAASSTYTYGDLLVVVNLPADIPSASRSSLRLFSFLQARGRTTAQNRLDPSLSGLASANVVKYLRTTSVPESVQGIGSVIYTISKVERGSSGNALILGCLDQSKLVQVRKDGSRFVAGAKKYPILKMTANISPGRKGPEVTLFTFAVGTC